MKIDFTYLVFGLLIFHLLNGTSGFAQVSEKDVRSQEEQEFGLTPAPTKQKNTPNAPTTNISLDDVQSEAAPEKIKPIEAEEFKAKIKKSSRSGRVIMIDDPTENRPRPGKILLVKNNDQDIVAIRVLKNYPGKFAAKIVLKFSDPQVDQEYRILKKLGDKIIAMIKEREKRGKDLDAAKSDEELATEVSPDDNELDRGIPAPKEKSPQKKNAKPEGNTGPEPLFTKDGEELSSLKSDEDIELHDEEEVAADLSIQEEHPLEPYRSALSAEYGAIRNYDKNGNMTTYSGFGARYGFNLIRGLFLKKKTIQDMLTLEVGLFYYTISSFQKADDHITIFPLVGTARYNLLIGENLMLFGYLGLLKNYVSQGEGETTVEIAQLGRSRTAAGVGGMLKLGPAWAARIDVGLDLFGIGAVLKF